jgi:hypothetical protein
MTKEALDQLIRDAIADGVAFPFLVTHCPRAVALLDGLIEAGQKTHGPMDWKDLKIRGNLDRSLTHRLDVSVSNGATIGSGKDDALLNATCRLLMALELREAAKEKK